MERGPSCLRSAPFWDVETVQAVRVVTVCFREKPSVGAINHVEAYGGQEIGVFTDALEHQSHSIAEAENFGCHFAPLVAAEMNREPRALKVDSPRRFGNCADPMLRFEASSLMGTGVENGIRNNENE